jgi:thioredoxin reductase (NADPH)
MNQKKMKEEILIIGAGPCGLAAAIALQKKGFSPLIIEKGNIVQAISDYPTHQTFFSTPDKLEIGDIPFTIAERKPKRSQALAYYREVVKREQLRIHSYEEVNLVNREHDGHFTVQTTSKRQGKRLYEASYVIVATGYYDHPNLMHIPGEELDKVIHYFKEAHPYFDQDVVVIGGKNSAVDAALELEQAGAHVTVLYRGQSISPSVKPWILPEFESLVRHGKIDLQFGAKVKEITPQAVVYSVGEDSRRIKNDFVFAMTGYHPDHTFISQMGVLLDKDSGRPVVNEETMETTIPNIFIAGVIAAGNNANEIFIENGRFHGELIASEIKKRVKKI